MKNRNITQILFFASALFLLSCSKTFEGDLIITNVNIIDVKTGEINYTKSVVIRGDSIANIIDHNGNTNYEAEQVVDASEKYLIPGLWDMHTHTWWGYEDFFPLLIANGVTGVREMFGDFETVKKIREELKSGAIIGPEIYSSGPIVDGDPPIWSSSDIADTPEKGREIVRQQKAGEADFIKVYFLLKKDVYLAIADECEKQNIPLTGHIPFKVSLEEAIASNHLSIEHFYGILEYAGDTEGLAKIDSLRKTRFNFEEYYKRFDHITTTYDKAKENALIELLSNSDSWICPTFTVHKGFHRQYDYYYTDDRIDYMPDYAMNGWKWITESDSILSEDNARMLTIDTTWYNKILSLVKPLHEKGAKFLAGTDYANPYTYPGFGLHEELEIFVNEAKLTPLQALQTATINPALFMKKESEFGTVETGKLASLVLLNKNPLDDIKNTSAINAVILKGKYLEGNALRDDIEKIATLNRLPKIRDVLSKIIADEGVDAAIGKYKNLKKEQPEAYNFNKEQLNTLAYELLGEGKTKEAIQLFELNVKEFPDYANGFDSLGDGYVAAKDTINAIKAYEISVEMGNNVSQPKLEALKKKE